jgi:hypothetical protein
MNKAAKKAVTRSKPVKKAAKATAASVKSVKKRSKSLSAAPLKPSVKRVSPEELTDEEWIALNKVPLAEVEVLAAKAVKMIKAKRSASAEEKAKRLRHVERKLEFARNRGGLSRCGAWGLKHPFGLEFTYIDWEAVLR